MISQAVATVIVRAALHAAALHAAVLAMKPA
jgi:hypothetical protein